jgi:peptidyl-tRNA hydrolase
MNNIFDLLKKVESEKSAFAPISFLIVGLGNPGKKYDQTRHNAGFLALDYIAQKENIKITKSKFKALCGECNIGAQRGLFIAPQTFMNNSGEAVREATEFYKIPPEKTIVLFDDISLPVGKIRIRKKGSDGGHNGIKSIIYHIGSDQFPRIKIGVGEKPHPEMELADWVLSRFTDIEKKELFSALEMACESAKLIAMGQTDQAMNLYN